MTYNRLCTPPKSSFFLLGMRGVGKSTWAKDSFPKAPRINLLLESLYQEYLQDPGVFERQIAMIKKGSWIIVDEIQRLPHLLNVVHNAIEEYHHKFILLGSSARKLRRAGVNLLGGRAEKKMMHPLLPEELGVDFSLEKVLQFGSIPLIWNAENKKTQLETYFQLYLKEEIQAEALVRNLSGFSRFLPVAALFHGQTLNSDGLARDAGVARTTVQGYLDILEDTLLAFRLPAFDAYLRVKERAHPKLYWLDNGVVRAAKKQLGLPTSEEKGVLFESFIIQTVRAYKDLGLLDCDELFYWSAGKSSVEVDLLVQRGNEFIAIEIKSSTRVHPDMVKGLKAISELKKVKKKLLIYLGDKKQHHSLGIDILPVGEFLRLLETGTL